MALLQIPKHREYVFASVFPVSSVVHTTPTPGATPEVGFPTPNQPHDITNTSAFGKTVSSSDSNATFVNALPQQPTKLHAQGDIDQLAAQIVKRDAAWSTATRFLTFPRKQSQRSSDVTEALAYLLAASSENGAEKGFNTRWEHGKEHELVSCRSVALPRPGCLMNVALMGVLAAD